MCMCINELNEDVVRSYESTMTVAFVFNNCPAQECKQHVLVSYDGQLCMKMYVFVGMLLLFVGHNSHGDYTTSHAGNS